MDDAAKAKAKKGGQLHALIAVAAATKGQAEKVATETKVTFTKKAAHFDGAQRTYRPLNDEGENLPPERKPLVSTTGEKLAHFRNMTVDALDVMFRIDETNMRATADITTGDLTIENVPSTFLMQFDKKLNEIRSVFESVPTLNPDYEWNPSNLGAGVWETEPLEKNRTQKELEYRVMVPPTEHHPAQVEKWMSDKVIGIFKESHQSGRLTPYDKARLLARLDKLQGAVKRALSKANQEEHSTRKVGGQIFEYLLGDIPLARGAKK